MFYKFEWHNTILKIRKGSTKITFAKCLITSDKHMFNYNWPSVTFLKVKSTTWLIYFHQMAYSPYPKFNAMKSKSSPPEHKWT